MKKILGMLTMVILCSSFVFGETAKKDAVITYLKSADAWLDINVISIFASEGDGLVTKKIQGLLANGADINAVDSDGKSALWTLINMSLPQSAFGGLLIMVPSPDARRDAFVERNAKMLIDQGINLDLVDSSTKTPALILAIKAGFTGLALKLVEKGANIALADKDGQNALRQACLSDYSGSVVDALAAKGADIREGYKGPLFKYNGWTALHYAASADNYYAVVNLVSRGANVNSVDGNKRSPLNLAVASTASHDLAYEIAEHLLFNGATLDSSGPNSPKELQQAGLASSNFGCVMLLTADGLTGINAYLKFQSIPVVKASDIDNTTAQPDEKTLKYLVAQGILATGLYNGKALKDFRVSEYTPVKIGKNGANRANFKAYALYVVTNKGTQQAKDANGNLVAIDYYYRTYTTALVNESGYQFRALKNDFDEWQAARY